jgi:hypothetical protein
MTNIPKHNIFGELALIRDIERGGTIIANSDLICLTLNKEDYSQVCSSTIKSESEKNIFFEKIFSRHLNKSSIIEIQHCFREVFLNRGTRIFREGDVIDKIWLVKSGDVL